MSWFRRLLARQQPEAGVQPEVEAIGEQEDPPGPRPLGAGDHPIRGRSEDRLRRSVFAAQLARQIALTPSGEGSVMALTGQWGSGKTSVLNLIKEALGDESAVIPLEFNPWLFATPEQLVGTFFDEISKELTESRGEQVRQLGRALRRFGLGLSPLRFVPVVGDYARVASEGLQSIGGAMSDVKVPSLRSQRDAIADALRQLDNRIVIFMDDIDRLRHDEVREVIRLVRLTADLPNVSFVLAFDRKVIGQALTEVGPTGTVFIDGDVYLEKIVQEFYELPVIPDADLERLLLEAIDAVVEQHPHGPFDDRHFLNTFQRGIRPLFTSVRDIRRYVSVLPVALETIGEEVAVVDVLGLEAIRLFLPDVFAGLPAASDLLTHTGGIGLGSALPGDGAQRFEALAASGGKKRSALEQLLVQLFPPIERYTPSRMNYGPDFLAIWRKERRVAHPEILAYYLTTVLPSGVLPARIVSLAVEALGDGPALTAVVEALDVEDFESLLGRLEDYEGEYDPDTVPTACIVLLHQHHRLPRGRTGMFGLESSMKLTRVILRLLRRVDGENRREEVVRTIFDQVPRLSAKNALLEVAGHREHAGHKLIGASLYEGMLDELADAVLAAKPEDLRVERDLAMLLEVAAERRSARSKEVEAVLNDDGVLLQMLRSAVLVGHRMNMGDAFSTSSDSIPWEAMLRLIPRLTLKTRLLSLIDSAAGTSSDPADQVVVGLAKEWCVSAEDEDGDGPGSTEAGDA